MKSFWLADEVLNWSAESEGGHILDTRKAQRAYDHLSRAEHFLNSPKPASADRADCISNLRKALTHRLHLFEDVYNLRPALNKGQKRAYLAVLAEAGVVRPFLLERLLKVRNAIEYRDAAPPSVARCHEFIDVVWYLLRSTDSLLSLKRTDLILRQLDDGDEEPPYWISIDITYRPTFRVRGCGWLPFELFSERSTVGTLEFKGEVGTRGQRWKNKAHLDKRPEDIWLNGQLILAPRQSLRLIKVALSC